MTEPGFDVVTIGDVVVDLTAAGRSRSGNVLYERNAGGGPANVVATVAALGGRSAFMGRVGDDHLGHFLEETLRATGVDTVGLRFDDAVGTRLVFIELDEHNDRAFTHYPSPRSDLEFRTEDIDQQLLARARIFHTCMLANLTPPIRQASEFALDMVRSAGGLVSFDPNWTQTASTDEVRERETIERVIPRTNILKLSLPELVFLQGDADLEDGARRLRQAGPELVLVTLGERGSYFQTESASGLVRAPNVRVADTTGAGDAFVGGLLFMLTSRRSSRPDLANVSEQHLREVVAFANACGAICAARRGSLRSVPSLTDVAELVALPLGDRS